MGNLELGGVRTVPDGGSRACSAQALRRLVLARNGLLGWKAGRGKGGRWAEGAPWREELRGEPGVLEAIRRLEAVQLDPVAVVARNHHLVLRNRVAGYRPQDLEALYQRKQVFEYMANARCVLPMEDYGLFEPVRAFFRSHQPGFSPELEEALTYVRERLAAEGPLASRSLESGTRVAGYWDGDVPKTKATSQALEHLWETGEVVVAGRRNDERFFALAVGWIGEVPGTDSWDPLLRKYLRAYGVTDLGDFRFGWRRWPAAAKKEAVDRLVREGFLEPVRVEGVRRGYVVLKELVPLLEVLEDASVAPEVFILPPLDNVLWRRERLADLFGFEYTWEIYVPAARRRYGPYTMPVLEGDRFIARLDAHVERERGVLQVDRLTFEPGVEPTPDRLARVWRAIDELARDIGAKDVTGRGRPGRRTKRSRAGHPGPGVPVSSADSEGVLER